MHEGVVQLIPCHIGILVGLVANNHIGHERFVYYTSHSMGSILSWRKLS